jgi:hypothetical protein
MTLREFRELSDAVEYERQSILSYQRHFYYCLLLAQGSKGLTPEKLLPLPLIDKVKVDRLQTQRQEILELGRQMAAKRLKNGRVKS